MQTAEGLRALDHFRNLLSRFSGQAKILTTQVSYIDFTGSHVGGLLLGQIIYWSDRTSDPEGWFYKTYADWFEELRLTEYQVRSAAKKFISQGWLETKVRKINGNPTMHYRVHWDIFSDLFLSFLSKSEVPSRRNFSNEPSRNSGFLPEETSVTNPEKLREPLYIHRILTESTYKTNALSGDNAAISPSPISNSSIPESEPNGQVSEIDLTAPEHQTGQLVKPTVDAVDQNSAAAAKKPRKKKNEPRSPRSAPAVSAHYPDLSVELWQLWSPVYVEFYGGLDDRSKFIQGFDWLIDQGVPVDHVETGLRVYVANKLQLIAAGRKESISKPPRGDRFFVGKDGGESYCLRAYEFSLTSQPVESTPKTDDGGGGYTNRHEGNFEAGFLAFLARVYCPKLAGMQTAEWDEFTAQDWAIRNTGPRLKNAEAAYKEFLANQKRRQEQDSARRDALAPVDMTADEVEALREAKARARQIVQEAILKRA